MQPQENSLGTGKHVRAHAAQVNKSFFTGVEGGKCSSQARSLVSPGSLL